MIEPNAESLRKKKMQKLKNLKTVAGSFKDYAT